MTTSFPNLNDEHFEDESMFPETDTCLFVGGPKHGQYVEVVKDDPVHKTIVQPNAPALMSGVAEVHTYVKRDLNLTGPDGIAYRRDVYVHESCPNPQVAQQLVMSALMEAFVKGGRKVVEGVSDRGSPSGG